MYKDEEYLKIKNMNDYELQIYINDKISDIDNLFNDHFSENIKSYPEKWLKKRKLFLESCYKYYGTPYKQTNFNEDDPEYHSDLFLDCCGLIRKAYNDISHITMGKLLPYNQGYQFDTLPDDTRFTDLLPGDLIFWEGHYHDKEYDFRPAHNIVHVEVYIGPGRKTMGARWRKGLVQEYYSYKFESSSYRISCYYYRSIDRWLNGEVRSHCAVHPWKKKVGMV
eukprot:Mrub_08530.p1 GENE.Mrub_08530~~Mrub_08530.p1  ORF type:complete len:257 (+),score=22.81 Mrub_08530:103-771(+)